MVHFYMMHRNLVSYRLYIGNVLPTKVLEINVSSEQKLATLIL